MTTFARKQVFKERTALIASENVGARIRSFLDATQKMSNSHENDNTRINILDSCPQFFS